MTTIKIQRLVRTACIILLLIQVPWYIAIQIIVNKTQSKTTATVINVERKTSSCPYTRNNICDGSDKLIPVYEYFDTQGIRHEVDDRYFGEFKQNNPLRIIFGKEKGDKVPAYYTKGKPEEILFMTGPFAYTAWLVPIYLIITLTLPLAGLYIYNKLTGRLPGKSSKTVH